MGYPKKCTPGQKAAELKARFIKRETTRHCPGSVARVTDTQFSFLPGSPDGPGDAAMRWSSPVKLLLFIRQPATGQNGSTPELSNS